MLWDHELRDHELRDELRDDQPQRRTTPREPRLVLLPPLPLPRLLLPRLIQHRPVRHQQPALGGVLRAEAAPSSRQREGRHTGLGQQLGRSARIWGQSQRSHYCI